MKTATIFQSDSVNVKSLGNGLSYTVTRAADGAELFVQDESATLFREEWEAWETANPDSSSADYLLGYLAQFNLEGRAT